MQLSVRSLRTLVKHQELITCNLRPSTRSAPAVSCCCNSRIAARAGIGRRQCVLIDRSSKPVEYSQVGPMCEKLSFLQSCESFSRESISSRQQGWELQRQCLNRVRRFAEEGVGGDDYLIILQHQPVFTLGVSA